MRNSRFTEEKKRKKVFRRRHWFYANGNLNHNRENRGSDRRATNDTALQVHRAKYYRRTMTLLFLWPRATHV